MVCWKNDISLKGFFFSKSLYFITRMLLLKTIRDKWLRDLMDTMSTLVQVMAWCRQAPSHYLTECWPDPWHHMVSLGQNKLSGVIWHCKCESTVDQVMAWCLTAPNHYLIQYWHITIKIIRNMYLCTFSAMIKFLLITARYVWRLNFENDVFGRESLS